MLLYRKEDKSNPIEFDDLRTANRLKNFVRENSNAYREFLKQAGHDPDIPFEVEPIEDLVDSDHLHEESGHDDHSHEQDDHEDESKDNKDDL